MLQHFTSKPVWYRIWAITVAIAAIYFLVRYIIGPLGSMDYAVATYALGSLVVDRVLLARQWK
ncbi:MAG TPA: hypothetical protein VK168_02810 [Saprospiraceae bacterium]|nr:hypothetical protein [Saprospiraceae bacterium]